MLLMNIFSTIGPKRANAWDPRRQLTATIVVLNFWTSLTKDSVLLRQIAVKYFHYWTNLANQKQKISIKYMRD